MSEFKVSAGAYPLTVPRSKLHCERQSDNHPRGLGAVGE